jgi:hypothetical protein
MVGARPNPMSECPPDRSTRPRIATPSISPAPFEGVLRCFHSEATEGFAAKASWDPLNGNVLMRRSDGRQ